MSELPLELTVLIKDLERLPERLARAAADQATLADHTDAAGRLWDGLKSLAEAVEALEDSLKLVAHSRPLPLSNGRLLVAVENHRTTLDPMIAEAIVKELRGWAAHKGVVETQHSTSKARIERSIKEHLPDGVSMAEAMREILKGIEVAGGVKTAYYYTESEVTPDEVTFNPDGSVHREIDGKTHKESQDGKS